MIFSRYGPIIQHFHCSRIKYKSTTSLYPMILNPLDPKILILILFWTTIRFWFRSKFLSDPMCSKRRIL